MDDYNVARVSDALHLLATELDCSIYEILEALEGPILNEKQVLEIINAN